MESPKNQFLCVKELVAEDGVHFKKGNCYTGKTKIFDESLTLLGEKDINVSFFGGNDYLKRLVYKGSIKPKDDGSMPLVKATYIILTRIEDDCDILGTVWNVDNREVIKLDNVKVDNISTIDLINAEDNTFNENKELLKKIISKLEKMKNKEQQEDKEDSK
ncbi:hypothetical protein ABE073_04910 [Lederbergia citrisecunda]|uniref:hypothetical protein n=1 Tax=Lederbergia citrisecunda TaxID=2833583 RepID=UPI003D2E8802